ncbi:hypothetical protein ACD661_03110 [Legionella lytica]|uniref:DUF4189 domain-containing protein n=1 Tax=Legionella lytica TaxID=96232 RepID=A0ABW8D4B0_9GAMM
MNYYVRIIFLFLLGFSVSAFAQLPLNGNFWQCTTYDASGKPWIAASAYRKVAVNFAFDLCKKESSAPATCKTRRNSCERFVQGVSVEPMWVCSALDRAAFVWRSNTYPRRDDAALAAKDFCRQRSTVPETCYINLITCVNKNGLD